MRSRASLPGRLASPTKAQRYGIFVAVMLAIAGGIIAIAIAGSRIEKDIAIGVTMLIESDATREAIASFDKTVKVLAAQAPLLQQGDKHGVSAIKPKGHYDANEWIALLTDAREELFIVGHALDKWCDQDHVREHFAEAIVRLASAGKRVQLVALPPDGEVTEKLGEQRDKVYTNRINHTMDALAKIRQDIPQPQRRNLHVLHLHENMTMPYMIAGNEHTLITAPYPTGTQESNKMPAITVASREVLGAALRSDMQWLIEHHCSPHTWT
jgi:hypothetical protein